jgi:RNA polymerase sigma factor (sigma-70 family)
MLTDLTIPAPVQATFDAFVADQGARLRRALVGQYGPELGTELAADVMAYAWEHWERVEGMANPVGYLYRVAQSSARRYRRWSRSHPLPPELPSARPQGDPALDEALAGLPERQRVIVILVKAHGYPYADVAEMLGVSHGVVRNELHRGMRRLRDLMDKP